MHTHRTGHSGRGGRATALNHLELDRQNANTRGFRKPSTFKDSCRKTLFSRPKDYFCKPAENQLGVDC